MSYGAYRAIGRHKRENSPRIPGDRSIFNETLQPGDTLASPSPRHRREAPPTGGAFSIYGFFIFNSVYAFVFWSC